MASPWPRSDSTLDLEDLVRMAKTAWLRTIYVCEINAGQCKSTAFERFLCKTLVRRVWESPKRSWCCFLVCSGQPLRYPSSARISSWARGGNFLVIEGPHCKEVPKGLVPAYCGLPGRRESTRAGRGNLPMMVVMVVIHALILSKCHKCDKCLKLWFGRICDLCTLDIQITQTFFLLPHATVEIQRHPCPSLAFEDADAATLPDIYDLRSRCFRRHGRLRFDVMHQR